MEHDAKGGARILVVDDEQDACDLLQLVLEQLKHHVTTTTSALAAVGKVAEEDFDLVLTDLNMPEMSGVDLCERILGTRPDMPVRLYCEARRHEASRTPCCTRSSAPSSW